jgi:hypothetical protein
MNQARRDPLAELIGDSPQIVAMREQIRRVLQRQSNLPVRARMQTGSHRLPPISSLQ